MSNNQNQGENSGNLRLIMLGKEAKNVRLRWLGNWVAGRSLIGRKAEKHFHVFRMRSTKKRYLVLLERKTPHYCLLKSPFHCRFCSAVCSPSCCWMQLLKMFLCSALGMNISVCFPIFLVLVEFWFNASIFSVLFSTLCVCLLTAVEIAASFLWQAPAFLCVTSIFLFILEHVFRRNSVNYAIQKSPPLQFRAFLRCDIQLLKETQELQGGWLPVVEEESAGKTLFCSLPTGG